MVLLIFDPTRIGREHFSRFSLGLGLGLKGETGKDFHIMIEQPEVALYNDVLFISRNSDYREGQLKTSHAKPKWGSFKEGRAAQISYEQSCKLGFRLMRHSSCSPEDFVDNHPVFERL